MLQFSCRRDSKALLLSVLQSSPISSKQGLHADCLPSERSQPTSVGINLPRHLLFCHWVVPFTWTWNKVNGSTHHQNSVKFSTPEFWVLGAFADRGNTVYFLFHLSLLFLGHVAFDLNYRKFRMEAKDESIQKRIIFLSGVWTFVSFLSTIT